MPAIEPIPTTAEGWPYLPDNAYIADVAAYTQALADALAAAYIDPVTGVLRPTP